MEIDIKKLNELKDIRKRREELERLEHELVRPSVTDFGQLSEMYRHFRDIHVVRRRGRENRYVVRKQFIFIAVWAFCPDALIGTRPPKRFRAELAKVMGLKSPQIISEELKDLLFYYTTYPQFRTETDLKYRIVLERIQESEGGQQESRPEGQDGN